MVGCSCPQGPRASPVFSYREGAIQVNTALSTRHALVAFRSPTTENLHRLLPTSDCSQVSSPSTFPAQFSLKFAHPKSSDYSNHPIIKISNSETRSTTMNISGGGYRFTSERTMFKRDAGVRIKGEFEPSFASIPTAPRTTVKKEFVRDSKSVRQTHNLQTSSHGISGFVISVD